MVVEADESDGTFLKLPTQIGVVTNIDPEHMDYWPSLEALHQAFQQFIEAIPFYGLAVACIDHPVVRELLAKLGGAANGRRTLTYGVARDADIRLGNLRPDHNSITFDADLGPAVKGGARKLEDLTLPVLGHYNALNALARARRRDRGRRQRRGDPLGLRRLLRREAALQPCRRVAGRRRL